MVSITGKVEAGLGRGAHFVRIYKDILKQHVGYDPYFGTLNVKIGQEDAKIVQKQPYKEIAEFSIGDTTYGAVRYFPATINGCTATIIIPVRTKHDFTTVEAISSACLRDCCKLQDGDEVSITF